MFSFLDRLSFSSNTPDKIGNKIRVSGTNTLTKTDNFGSHVAIANEASDATVDGMKIFCALVENAGVYPTVMIGFTSMETFDSTKQAYFGNNGFHGCGIFLIDGNLFYPVGKNHNIIDKEISNKAKEIIVILTISNNGTKKEIRFLFDGKESQSSDVSEHLQRGRIFPAVCLFQQNQQVTTIPIEQIEKRTQFIDHLIDEYTKEQKHFFV
jgi:hypothetical protein